MRPLIATAGIAAAVVVGAWFLVSAQSKLASPQAVAGQYSGAIPAAALLRVPVTGIYPGNVNQAPKITNPLVNDPNAAQRGMKDFDAFNCSSCHAANGAGGMGPSLSNDRWIYRASDANIYLTIVQGRANGMPAWGAVLPDRTVWELVAYIRNISEKPTGKFGNTTSAAPPSPDREQVPADKMQTTSPWEFTEPFANGQRPGTSP